MNYSVNTYPQTVRLHDTVYWLDMYNGNPSNRTIGLAPDYTSAAGKISFHLSATSSTNFTYVETQQYMGALNTLANNSFVLRFWVKANNLNTTPSMLVKYYSSGVQNTIRLDGVSGTYDWAEYSLASTAQIPSDANNFNLAIGIFGSSGNHGECWISGIRFTTDLPVVQHPPQDLTFIPTDKMIRGLGIGANSKDNYYDFYHMRKAFNSNVVRFQITGLTGFDNPPISDYGNMTQYDAWFSGMMVTLDKLVAKCKMNDMKIVINYQGVPGLNVDPRANFTTEYNNTFYDKYIANWKFLTTKFLGNNAIYAFDVLNEPAYSGSRFPQGPTDKNWWTLQVDAYNAIRSIDPTRTVIFENDGYADPVRYYGMPFLSGATNVIYSFHMYKPGNYTSLTNTTHVYPGFIDTDGIAVDKNRLRQFMQPVRDFQLSYKVPIYIGEFACPRYAPGAAQYLQDCISIFEEYGWLWNYHGYGGPFGWKEVDLEKENVVSPEIVSVSGTDRFRVVTSAMAINTSFYTSAEQAPIAPNNVVVTENSNSVITVSWDLPTMVSDYIAVDWKPSVSASWINTVSALPYVTSATVSGFSPGVNYDIRARLVGPYGQAPTSGSTINKNVYYLFNQISATPTRAYSVKKIVSNYNGPILRVRRSSDNAEQDIFALSAVSPSATSLDVASLSAFVGASTSAWVSKWYDQGPNGWHISATSANQPFIVSAGNLITNNGIPAVRFFGNHYLLDNNTSLWAASATTLYGVIKQVGSNSLFWCLAGEHSTSSNNQLYYYSVDDKTRNIALFVRDNANTTMMAPNGSSADVSGFMPNIPRSFMVQDNRSYTTIGSNVVGETFFRSYTSGTSALSLNRFGVGARVRLGPDDYISAEIQELVFLPTLLNDTDKTNIKNSQIYYYNLS